jgi:hypothetical protein
MICLDLGRLRRNRIQGPPTQSRRFSPSRSRFRRSRPASAPGTRLAAVDSSEPHLGYTERWRPISTAFRHRAGVTALLDARRCTLVITRDAVNPDEVDRRFYATRSITASSKACCLSTKRWTPRRKDRRERFRYRQHRSPPCRRRSAHIPPRYREDPGAAGRSSHLLQNCEQAWLVDGSGLS